MPSNLNDMEAVALEEWANVLQERWQKLVSTYPNHILVRCKHSKKRKKKFKCVN